MPQSLATPNTTQETEFGTPDQIKTLPGAAPNDQNSNHDEDRIQPVRPTTAPHTSPNTSKGRASDDASNPEAPTELSALKKALTDYLAILEENDYLAILEENQESLSCCCTLWSSSKSFRQPTSTLAEQLIGMLTAIRPKEAGKLANTSVIYWLTCHLDTHPQLMEALMAGPIGSRLLDNTQLIGMLTAIRPKEAGKLANTSAIYWLAGYNNTRPQLMKALVAKRADGTQLINEPAVQAALTAIRPKEAGEWTNTSAMYYLAQNRNTRPQLMKALVAKRADGTQLINEPEVRAALTAICPKEAGEWANTSAMYGLAQNQNTRPQLMKALVAKRADGTQLINEPAVRAALTAIRPKEAGEGANTSTLYGLAQNQNTRPQLMKALVAKRADGTQLINEPAVRAALTAIRPKEAGEGANTSTLYGLAQNQNTRPQLMKALVAKRTDGTQLINEPAVQAALTAIRPKEAGKWANASAIYWLAHHPNTHSQLMKALVAIRADGTQLIDNSQFIDALMAIRPKEAGKWAANTSALCFLPDGARDRVIKASKAALNETYAQLNKANDQLTESLKAVIEGLKAERANDIRLINEPAVQAQLVGTTLADQASEPQVNSGSATSPQPNNPSPSSAFGAQAQEKPQPNEEGSEGEEEGDENAKTNTGHSETTSPRLFQEADQPSTTGPIDRKLIICETFL